MRDAGDAVTERFSPAIYLDEIMQMVLAKGLCGCAREAMSSGAQHEPFLFLKASYAAEAFPS